MEHIRRCMLVFILALLAACGTIQAPEATPEPIQLAPSQQVIKKQTNPEPAKKEEGKETENKKERELVSRIAKRFHQPEKLISEILDLVSKYAFNDFPSKIDILSIIAIESKFNPKASYHGSKGVMQVLVHANRSIIHLPFELEEQIRVGTRILRQDYEELGNEKAAVMAYNAGLAGYKRGKKPTNYYKGFQSEKRWFKYQEQQLGLV